MGQFDILEAMARIGTAGCATTGVEAGVEKRSTKNFLCNRRWRRRARRVSCLRFAYRCAEGGQEVFKRGAHRSFSEMTAVENDAAIQMAFRRSETSVE